MVKIYTTKVCKYCKLAKEFFKENDISYEEIDISKDEAAKADILEKTGRMSVPVIQIGDDHVVGYDEDILRKLLNI